MAELDARVVLELERRGYTRGLREAGRETSRFAGTSRRALSVLDRGLGRVANRWTALAGGFAGVQAVRGVAQLEARMVRLGTQADISADQVDQLKQQVFDVARQRDVSIDTGELFSAVEAIVEKTGDLQFAQDNIRTLGLAIQATGAQGSAIGEIVAEMQKMELSTEEVAEAIDVLNAQGKEGAFTLQNLAALGPRVVTAYTALGAKGVPALRQLGATLQVVRQGTGNAEQAATAFEAVLRTLSDKTKVEFLQGKGIQLFDQKALEDGREVLRPINDILLEIMEASGGRRTALSEVFDAEAIRALNALGSGEGSKELLNRLVEIEAAGTTARDSARNAQTAAAAMQNLSTAFTEFADENLTEPLKDFSDFVQSLDQKTLDRWLTLAKWLGIGLGGIVAGRFLFGAGRDLINTGRWVVSGRSGGALARGGGGGGAVGGALGAAGGLTPVPVFVVNGGGFGRGARQLTRASSRLGRAASALSRGALGLTASGFVGWQIGTAIDQRLQSTESGREIRHDVGRAIADTMELFGSDAARRANAVDERQNLAERQRESFEGRLDINIDQNGRVRVGDLQQSSRSPLEISVESGVNMGITG